LYVIKECEAVDAARSLGVPVAQIYLAKHRVSALVKKELELLKARLA
jgi:RNA polymerase sigma-70 factor (ECF subfamily)